MVRFGKTKVVKGKFYAAKNIWNINIDNIVISKLIETKTNSRWLYYGTSYLLLFGSEKYGAIYNKISYLVSLKSSITYVFFPKLCKNQS